MTPPKNATIEFTCEIIKVETREDHAVRVTLDIPESDNSVLAKLIEAYQRGGLLEIIAVAYKINLPG